MRILTRKKYQDDMAKMWSEAVHAEYKAQIEAAVLAEREACAKVCETLELPEWPDKVRQPLAQAIRARGQA
jgi:stalled ribosome rescue protein Dom34